MNDSAVMQSASTESGIVGYGVNDSMYMRQTALSYAIQTVGAQGRPESVIAAAAKYYEFLTAKA